MNWDGFFTNAMKNRPPEQGAPLRIDAVGERVTAPQDAGAAVVLEAGQPDVRVRRDGGPEAAGALGVEVGRGELGTAGQRGAGHLGPADDLLLVLQVVPVPVFDEDPDLPRHQVTAAAQPGLVRLLAHPHGLVHQVGLLGLDVAGAVLEAEQVARGGLGGRRGRGAAEPELHPVVLDHAHADPGQVPHGVERHQRVVRAGLDAQVAAGVVRVQVLVRQGRQLGQRGRASGRPARTGCRTVRGRSRR